jgi:uncharacterized protein
MAVSVIGSALGAWVLLTTPEAMFSALVPWLLLAATMIFTFSRPCMAYMMRKQRGKQETGNGRGEIEDEGFSLISCSPFPVSLSLTLQFLIAFYGGYFGAGIGILMLAVLIFVASGRVPWPETGVMLAGGVLGGYFGARTALKLHPERVRRAVSAVGLCMSAYFFIR